MCISVIEAYVKTNFAPILNNKLNKIIGCGSLTDGTYKLQVHIINYNNDDYFAMDIKKGDKVEILGSMVTNGKDIYIHFLYFEMLYVVKNDYLF